jgi:hypothetical protein
MQARKNKTTIIPITIPASVFTDIVPVIGWIGERGGCGGNIGGYCGGMYGGWW